jgi:hypothetical protein
VKFFNSLFFLTILINSSQSFAYNVVDRYKLLDDKLRTDAMLRPIDHDFIFDINASINKNITTLMSDVSDASKASSISSAQDILRKYENTEQTIKLDLNFGVPLFSFTAFNVKIKPNLRLNANFGANVGIKKDTLTLADALSIINVSVPASVQANFTNAWWNGTATNADLFSTANCTTYFGTPVEAHAFCLANQNLFFKPDTSVPNINLYVKGEARFGLYNQYTSGEHFFGDLNLYAMGRADGSQVISAAMIANGAKIELPKKANTEGTAQLDYHYGYKNSNYSVMAGLEELKLMKFKKKDEAAKEQSYGYGPMMRLHAEAKYNFSVLTLQPFTGFHKRSGYGFGDGVYLGVIASAHVWGDRLGLIFRGEFDKQYITFSPRIKLWLMQLEYTLKSPIKKTDGDLTLSAIQSVDFRLFF